MRNFTLRLFIITCFLSFLSQFASAQAPVANFTASTLSGCAPLVVSFTSTSTGNPTTYAWNLGNSVTSSIANPSTTYSAAGTYPVTLTVTNSSGSDTKTVTSYITVYGSPTVDFSATPQAACPGSTIQFNDLTVLNAPGSSTYNWNFGNGNSSALQNPSVVFNTPGAYNITLQVTNGSGCVKTTLKTGYLQIYAKPNPDFSATPVNFCTAPATTTFSPVSTGSSYAWTYGDGNTGSSNTHTYGTSGIYTVTLVVTDNHSCKDTMVKPAYINVAGMVPGFTTSINPCQGMETSFTNTTTPAPTAVLWRFGDGSTANTTNATHIYGAAGTYTVTMIATNNGCTDSIAHTITVHPKPVAAFSFSPHNPCPAPAVIQFTNTSTGATSYSWLFGDGGTSSAANPAHTYATNNWFTPTLVAISGFGCTDTLIKTDSVRIHDLTLEINVDSLSGCVPLPVNFTLSKYTSPPFTTPYIGPYPYPFPISSYHWDFDDGTTSNVMNPTHVFTTDGVFNVVVTVTTAYGCVVKDSILIQAGIKPVAGFTATPTTACLSDTVHFTNTSTGATDYNWTFGEPGGQGSTDVNPDHKYVYPGTWTVTLVASKHGCRDTIKKVNYINALPSKSIMNLMYDCDTPTLVKFTNASVGATSHIWIFGDGTTSIAANPFHVYPALGSYTVQLATENSTTGCKDTATEFIDLFIAQPDFASNDTAICKDGTVTFTATNLSRVLTNYSLWKVLTTFWDSQYPVTNSYTDYTQTFNDTGHYTIKFFYVDEHYCVDSITKTGYQLVSRPNANFGGSPLQGCVPVNTQFMDTSTFVSGTYATDRAWDFGDGTTLAGNITNPLHSYTTGGLFDVQLIVTDNVGCSDTMVRTGYVDARDPQASFLTADTSICPGDNITFASFSTGTNLTYSWTLGDGTTSTAVNPNHTYGDTGVYTVGVVITDDIGCTDTLIKLHHISITKPVAAFTMSDTFAICPPLLVQFANASVGASSYEWDFGNANNSTLPNPSNVYNVGGVYNISLVSIDPQGCKDTATGHVKVLGYNGALTYSPLTGCEPLNVNFTSLINNIPVLVWDFADGVTTAVTAGGTISHTYTTRGAYVPRLIMGDGASCVSYSYGLDTIKVDGVTADFKYATPACIKSPVQFTDQSQSLYSTPVGWLWTFHDGTQAGNSHPAHTYDTVNTYNVELVAIDAMGCRDTVVKQVTTIPLPVISAGLDTVICVGDAAMLSPSGGVSYVWSPGATLSCTSCTNPLATPASLQHYVVVGKGANGCYNRDTVTVKLKTKTVSSTTGDKEMCAKGGVMLQVNGAQVYQWTPSGTLENSTSATPIAHPTETTIYTIIATEGSCIPDTHRVKVIVHPLPIVDAGYDLEIVAGQKVELHASGNAIKYVWTNDGTLSCSECPKPWATTPVTTEYTVTGYTDYGCVDSDKMIVHVLCDQGQVFIPNTFTPNGDGHNDYFYPRGTGIDMIKSFKVFDRWGELVYQAVNVSINDKTKGWDGTYKGQLQQPDAFVYMIEATCITGELMHFKGDVTLIR